MALRRAIRKRAKVTATAPTCLPSYVLQIIQLEKSENLLQESSMPATLEKAAIEEEEGCEMHAGSGRSVLRYTLAEVAALFLEDCGLGQPLDGGQ